MRDAKGRFIKGPLPPGVVRDEKGRFKNDPETDELEMLLHPLRYANGSRIELHENKASSGTFVTDMQTEIARQAFQNYKDGMDIEQSWKNAIPKPPSLFQRIKRRLTGK